MDSHVCSSNSHFGTERSNLERPFASFGVLWVGEENLKLLRRDIPIVNSIIHPFVIFL